MTDETIADLTRFKLRFGRIATLCAVNNQGSLRMLRLVRREGIRITQTDLDEASTRASGPAILDGAGSPPAQNG